VTKGYFDAT